MPGSTHPISAATAYLRLRRRYPIVPVTKALSAQIASGFAIVQNLRTNNSAAKAGKTKQKSLVVDTPGGAVRTNFLCVVEPPVADYRGWRGQGSAS